MISWLLALLASSRVPHELLALVYSINIFVCFLGDFNANYSTETIFSCELKALIADNDCFCYDEVSLEPSTFTYLIPSGHTSWTDHVVCSSSFRSTLMLMPISVRYYIFG